ncbi:MAG: N-acetylmuramoyl-L-alanine amidase [Anaerolineales bacterium]
MKIVNDRLVLDNDIPVRFVPSPNHGSLLLEKAFVVIHFTEGSSFEAAITWLTDPASQVSSHLVIGRNGEVAQLLPFTTIGWHAGVSTWEQYTQLNSYSVGIELDNAGRMKRSGNQWVSAFGKVYPDSEVMVAAHKANPSVVCGWHKFTDIQLQTTTEIVAALIRTYGFREIVGHDDIAPKRKWDPGPAFPMDQFRLDVAALVNAGATGDGQGDGATTIPKPPDDGGSTPTETPPGSPQRHYKLENIDTGQSTEYTLSTAYKPVVLLPVPYVSQFGSGANPSVNDCGAASAVMLLRAYQDTPITPDEFHTKFASSGAPYLSVQQLWAGINSLGVSADSRTNLGMQDLFTFLAAGKPLITPLHYKTLADAGLTEQTFDGPYFAVVVGMDIQNIYIHDPLYANAADGEARSYPLELFGQAWKDVAADPNFPNPACSAIVPTLGIGFQLTRKVKVTTASLNIRKEPALTASPAGSLKKDQIVEITRELNGWGEIPGVGWISLSYTATA